MQGLCVGIGHADGPCGLLTGGACALGLLAGKGADDEEAQPLLEALLNDYAQWFRERTAAFGGSSCDTVAAGLAAERGETGSGGAGRPDPAGCGDLLAEAWEKLLELVQAYDVDLMAHTGAGMSGTARTLHRTQSVCPVCLRRIDAAYVREGETVFFRKTCPQHGSFAVPVLRQAEGLPAFEDWQRPKTPSYPARPLTEAAQGCPFDCGLCPGHAQHTCTALLEVTLRCDMLVRSAMPRRARRDVPPDPDMATLLRRLDRLRQVSPGCNVQLSGGEPTQRDDLPDIIRAVRARGFGLVQVNSNGLRLGRDPAYAVGLREAGLDSVYLQWDGPDDAACAPLRGSLPQGESLMARKAAAVRHCAAAGLGVVLVATLMPEANLPRLAICCVRPCGWGPLCAACICNRFPASVVIPATC